MGLQPLPLLGGRHRDHHLPLTGGLERIEGPEQGVGLQHQHPVEPADRGIFPEAAAQLVEPFPFGGGLALQPALQQGILR